MIITWELHYDSWMLATSKNVYKKYHRNASSSNRNHIISNYFLIFFRKRQKVWWQLLPCGSRFPTPLHPLVCVGLLNKSHMIFIVFQKQHLTTQLLLTNPTAVIFSMSGHSGGWCWHIILGAICRTFLDPWGAVVHFVTSSWPDCLRMILPMRTWF